MLLELYFTLFILVNITKTIYFFQSPGAGMPHPHHFMIHQLTIQAQFHVCLFFFLFHFEMHETMEVKRVFKWQTYTGMHYPIASHKQCVKSVVIAHLGLSDNPMILCMSVCLQASCFVLMCIYMQYKHVLYVCVCGQGADRPRGSEPQLQTQ